MVTSKFTFLGLERVDSWCSKEIYSTCKNSLLSVESAAKVLASSDSILEKFLLDLAFKDVCSSIG